MSRFVPVTMGSPEFLGVHVDGFRVTAARFAPLDYLSPHQHEHATVAVMLDGSFDLCIGGKTLPCLPGTAFTEPPGERHANRVQRDGAHVLVLQPDLARTEQLGLDARLVHQVQQRSGRVMTARLHRREPPRIDVESLLSQRH